MKKITFPHMGNLWIAASAFFREMGLEVIVPPEMSARTLDLGVKYSPEFACLPFKLNIGNFVQSLENGAETIIMGGGVGPCRFGYYGELQREILLDNGYDFEIIILEPEIWGNIKKLKRLFGTLSLKKIKNAAKLAWLKIKVFHNMHSELVKNRPYEIEKGKIDQIYKNYLYKLDKTNSFEKIIKLDNEFRENILCHLRKTNKYLPLRVGIVGEIYLVLESFINLQTEKRLGQLGVLTKRQISLKSWILNFLNFGDEHEKIIESAIPYLNSEIGGHGIDSVGNTVRFAKKGYDGIVQILPFTCMPEIVAGAVLPEIAHNEDIAVLSLVFDEHTGEAGLQTRLEAFVDMISRKKERRVN
ncbi:MAG: CoA protein activase [Halanaerobiales bacterium]